MRLLQGIPGEYFLEVVRLIEMRRLGMFEHAFRFSAWRIREPLLLSQQRICRQMRSPFQAERATVSQRRDAEFGKLCAVGSAKLARFCKTTPRTADLVGATRIAKI